jgi:Na+/phosphate symporter
MSNEIPQGLQSKTLLVNRTLASIAPPTFLTPESLLVYCRSRLHELDATIQDRFDKENKTVELQKKLGAIKSYIAKAAEDGVSDGEHGDIANMVDAAKALTNDPDLTAQLQALADGSIGADAKKGAALGQNIDDICKDLGSGRELAMVELQSIVSQRQTALQLTTNLLSAVNESARNITNNIK